MYICSITAIDKVSGVAINCNPLDLMIQCVTVWNVNTEHNHYVHALSYLIMCTNTYIHTTDTSGLSDVYTYSLKAVGLYTDGGHIRSTTQYCGTYIYM